MTISEIRDDVDPYADCRNAIKYIGEFMSENTWANDRARGIGVEECIKEMKDALEYANSVAVARGLDSPMRQASLRAAPELDTPGFRKLVRAKLGAY
jgi:hypothetical protein